MKHRVISGIFFILGLLVAFPGYAEENLILRLASTTSTRASGLLDVLIPVFEKQSGYKIVLSITGSGKAMQLGRKGEADLLWVHSPEEEKAFISHDYGLQRHYTMHNDFLIACPASDPAGVGSSQNVSDAMQRIAKTKSLFISRGDDSGTHNTELQLWEMVGVEPYGKWYYELGHGMKKTLDVANEKQAYVLVDRATWLFNRKGITLKECFQGDPALLTEYSLIAVNPARHEGINHAGAEAFIRFVTSAAGQEIIMGHKVKGRSLFKRLSQKE